MKGASILRQYSAIRSQTKFATASVAVGALAYANKDFREKLTSILPIDASNYSLCDTAEQ